MIFTCHAVNNTHKVHSHFWKICILVTYILQKLFISPFAKCRPYDWYYSSFNRRGNDYRKGEESYQFPDLRFPAHESANFMSWYHVTRGPLVYEWLFAAEPELQVQCCFTSTETARTIRDWGPRTATSTFTQLLNSDTGSSVMVSCYQSLHLSARFRVVCVTAEWNSATVDDTDNSLMLYLALTITHAAASFLY